jgi:hypothetical protein
MPAMHTTSAQLLYIATRARPDILYPVSYLTTRVKKYTVHDRLVLTRILQYLYGTINFAMTLCIPDTKNITISLFVDSSFHSHADGKSHSGACLTLGSGFISWRSTKQSLTTKSSTEAELVAASDQSSMLFHMRNFLAGQGIRVKDSVLFQDNTSTISLLTNANSSSQRTAHINTKYFFLRENIESGDIKIIHMPTNDMIADILTKALQGGAFKFLVRKILGE